MNPIQFIQLFTDRKIVDNTKVFKLDDRYFLGSEWIGSLLQKPEIRPTYFGTYLGIEGRMFIPSFFLLEKLRDHSKKAIINEKAAWLFICGRDILSESVVKADPLNSRDYLLVMNENKEILGYGYYIDGKIRNLLDRGDFLRRERIQAKEQEQ
jgi:ribosome biogenesis protein Nip4